MPTAYIAFGSNLGNREEYIQSAIKLLEEHSITILRISSIIETEPIGGPPQGNYLNGVACVKTQLKPLELLDTCLIIENTLKRVRTEPNGPRTIDLDILLYDDIILNTPELTLPHPRMHERNFVLKPLYEIAPHLKNANI